MNDEKASDAVVQSTENPQLISEKEEKPVATILEVGSEKEEKIEEKKESPGITIDGKDYKYLKKNKYDEVRQKFTKTFVLQHKQNKNKIVELRAASATHACKLIHWKPNQVKLLAIKEDETSDVIDSIHSAYSKSLSDVASHASIL
jgi:hypothetical protein